MAHAVRTGALDARTCVERSLARIAATEPRINAFTAVLAERALARAEVLDRNPARASLPLAGVPFAVKNLFDIAGLPTLAGASIERDSPPAIADGLLVTRLEAAGAILVGALNMDEYAYGFTTENTHYGATRNPRDTARSAGGSSGGSAAAVAAGQVPLALGSDTNGSIRVPASLCGVFGLKPTFGRLPRTGSYPFVASLDHLGAFARTVHDLALCYDLMQGHDTGDAGCVARPAEPTVATLEAGIEGLRIATLGGWWHEMADVDARSAHALVARFLASESDGVQVELPLVELPEVARARAAAFLISNAEGANLHLPDLRKRAQDFEPLSRDRMLAGALLPAAWVQQAQRVRRWFAERVAEVFERVDILLAPATPCVAPVLGTDWLELGGERLPARASLGLLAQPLSCIGVPVVTVPVWGASAAHPGLPIGVQVIAAPWREDLALRVARRLEAGGFCHSHVAALD